MFNVRGEMIFFLTLRMTHHVRMTEELYGQFKTHSADLFDIEAVTETGV